MATTTTTTTTPFPLEMETLLFEDGMEVNRVTKRRGAFNFGTLAPGQTSDTIIVQLKGINTTALGRIKIALIDTGDITFAPNIFGITTTFRLSSSIEPEEYFEGVNTDGLASNPYNIDIDTIEINKSDYVYLNVAVPSNQTVENGVIRYKWFFDYAL